MKPTDQIKEKLENANSKEETHTQIPPSKFGGSFNQNQGEKRVSFKPKYARIKPMKKKSMLWILAAILLFSGCQNTGKSGETKEPDTKTTEYGIETEAAQAVEKTDEPEAEDPKTEETEAEDPQESKEITGVYLGVKEYGAPETNKENRDHFLYRFLIDDQEVCYSVDNGTDYPIQNQLKENSVYLIKEEDGIIKEVTEKLLPSEEISFTPVVQGTPGETTIKNFLETALMPVGTALYIYGGGWDWQDEGSSVQSRTIGVPSDWVRFFREQDTDYNYKSEDPTNSYYPYGEYNEYYYAGADCSGYLGWVLYNTFHTTDLEEGYVGSSTKFAKWLAEDLGYGTWSTETENIRPGDIMSIKGHVWICLGKCSDGSVVILHSTPSESRSGQPGGGVQISALGDSDSCEAYALAKKYMSEYYPEWNERYEAVLRDPGLYFSTEAENAGLFSWDTTGVVTDPDGIREMKADEVLKTLFQVAGE